MKEQATTMTTREQVVYILIRAARTWLDGWAEADIRPDIAISHAAREIDVALKTLRNDPMECQADGIPAVDGV